MSGKKGMKGSGGKREGAGRSLKYGEETQPVVIRVPKSKVTLFKTLVAALLKGWQTKKKTK